MYHILTHIHVYMCFLQILMSVAMEEMIALKHVQTLKEISIVDVIVAFYWMMMGLLVMVCIQTCSYMTGTVKTSLTFQPFFYKCKITHVHM